MPDFLEYLRQQNIFGVPPIYGNDLPQQGGITGNMPPPANPIPQPIMGPGVMTSDMQLPPEIDPTPYIPPPQFGRPGINAPDIGMNELEQPFQNIQFGQGPLDVNQGDIASAKTGVLGQAMPDEGMDAGARMRELYHPQDDASRRFDQMIAQYPQEDNPSWLRRIGAMVVDYTKGSKRGEEVFHEPYNKKIAEWKDKIGPAQQAAVNERYENVNDRTMAYNQMAIELRERAQIAREQNDERKAQIQQQRADIYAFKATHPNFKFIMPKGGNIQAMDPATGQAHDTGIPTGSLTEIDKLHIGQEQALERIDATGEQARKTENVRQSGRLEAIDARGKQARETRATPSGGVGGAGKSESATQSKAREYISARQIVNSSPALEKFIKLGSGNEFTIIKPNERGGPTPQQYSDIINSIYGKAGGGRNAGAGPGPGQPIKTPPKSPKPGWHYEPKPGGGWTAVKDTGVQ